MRERCLRLLKPVCIVEVQGRCWSHHCFLVGQKDILRRLLSLWAAHNTQTLQIQLYQLDMTSCMQFMADMRATQHFC